MKLAKMRSAGLSPIVAVDSFPAWARDRRPNRDHLPNRAKLAAFMEAVAKRYRGEPGGPPRIDYWQLWIEPNISLFFWPQVERGRLVSPVLYRQLLASFTPAVKRGNPRAKVIAGGLAPFGVRMKPIAIAPMRFMRHFLCMSKGAQPRPTCRARAHFDIWAHHPYTSGGPTREAYRPDDVSLGDLPEMLALLRSAERARQIVARQRVEFWVTEFSWDTAPPDPKAPPAGLHARWVAEALHVMWKADVSLVVWLSLRDEPYPASPYQSGLYFRGATLAQDRPKPALSAFRFPFVAYKQGRGLRFWGRTPESEPGSVVIEQRTIGGWRRLTTVSANRYGIFRGKLATRSGEGSVRARLAAGGASRSFSLFRPPDRFYPAFGGGGGGASAWAARRA